MKKIYLSLIAVAAIFSACEKNDVLVDAQSEAAPKAIAFESFSQAATRATENNSDDYAWDFFNHHTTFQVWGYKNTAATTPVFNGDVVTVASDGAATPTYTYTYSPLRYWDKAATKYEYYAAAPSGADWTFVDTGITDATTQDKGYFTTSSTLAGTNLSTDTETGYVQSFKAAAGDVDKLIAAPKAVAKAQFSSTVQLDFIHILSRLNVTIKKGTVLDAQTVTMKSLTVNNLLGKGDFSEATAADPAGTYSRWSNQSTPITTYNAVSDTEVTTAAKYVLQSLVIPQASAFEAVALDGTGVGTSSKPYLVITYEIWDGVHSAESFTAYYNLANAFGRTSGELAFNEGWQNTLNITLNPDVIDFCATVAEWSTVEEDLDIK